MIPYETQIVYGKNKNTKNTKTKEKSLNKGLAFNPDESYPRHQRNISMDEKTAEARNIQKMVNNLQSYISNYTNGLEDSINNMYKNKTHFIFKEKEKESYMSDKSLSNHNNNYKSNSSNRNQDTFYQIKIKNDKSK